MPIIGHPIRTKKNPIPNEMEPLKFWGFMKNSKVDFTPMVSVNPDKKRIFPIARRPLSKKRKTPINVNNTPNPVNPSPIFFTSLVSKEIIAAPAPQSKPYSENPLFLQIEETLQGNSSGRVDRKEYLLEKERGRRGMGF